MNLSSLPLKNETRETSPVAGLDLDMVFEAPYRPRVLIIDDEPDTVFLLKEILRMAGFDVLGAFSCDQALNKVTNSSPDVILLDLMMPGIDGWVTYEYLRQITEVPVMIVSALSSKDMVVRGLQMGAEDYMTKPFHKEELVARVRNLVKFSAARQPVRRLSFPSIDLNINLDAREVTMRGAKIHLTSREFSVLVLLARNAPNMVRYEDIAKEIWGEDTSDVRKSIKYLIYLLRHKLEADPSNPVMIINSEKLGYKLQTEVEIRH